MNILETENPIQEIKKLSPLMLQVASSQIRKSLLESVSKTGGHLASNLGAVELTVSLHKVFDTPTDKIIWDVGHQAYVHKMLTGRYSQMNTLRKLDGISGFPKRCESEHDMFDSGHSGSSISAAYGYAKARDIKGEDYNVVAVIGDGSLTSGVAWEALNSAGSSRTPMIVVLNDNKMSISDNVGGLPRHLERLRTSKGYINFKQSIKDNFEEDSKVYSTLKNLRNTVKYATMPGVIFEELGFKYFGPINGHSCEDIINALELAKSLKRPVLIHIVTQKGKGFAPAEENPTKFHGVGAFDPEKVDAVIDRDEESWSEIFGRNLSYIAKENDKICAISAAMSEATGLTEFKFRFPERFFDVGIAEQHAVSFAAGLALNGMRPVVAIYSTFLQRAYDQILTEVCLQNLPVVFAVDRAGIVGPDGETHQGIFDIEYLSSMPNMTVLSPKDGKELIEMLRYALTLNGPCAIRYPRGKAPDLSKYSSQFTAHPELLTAGADICIVSDGNMVPVALGAAEMLEDHGISTAVCNIRIIKPFPEDYINQLFLRYRNIVVIEDGSASEGIGVKIQALATKYEYGNRVLSIAWPDKFIESGSIGELRARYGMNAIALARKTEAFLEEKA